MTATTNDRRGASSNRLGAQGREVTFWVPGQPRPKGSLKNVARRGQKARFVEQVEGSKEWRATVADAAGEVWASYELPRVYGVALAVRLDFHFPRPVSHYRGDLMTLSAAGLKYPRPSYAKGIGDSDKLARNVLDALTDAEVWGDDGQACDLIVSKEWCRGGYGAAAPGVWVAIRVPSAHG
jgi:Holliday junction resolvase RusA-like endonuclease